MPSVAVDCPQSSLYTWQLTTFLLLCRFLSQGIQHVCQELILPLPPQDTREPLCQWREADQLHLSALAQILGVRMEIFSVLGKNFSHTRYQELRTNAGAIRLVLHSGHYDLIY